MKNSKFLLLAAVLIGAVELAGWRVLFPDSFQTTFDPVTRDDVVVPYQVLLGELECGEQQRQFVTITNNKRRPICLEAPRSECGCIQFEYETGITIEPGESQRIAFDYEAPLKPGFYEKDVLLKFASMKNSWKIPVSCKVDADAWVLPGKLDLLLDEGQSTKRAALHLAEAKTIGRISCSHPDLIQAIPNNRSTSAKVHPFRIDVAASQAGEASISFHDRVNDEIVKTIPVSWRKPKVIECLPKLVVWHPTQTQWSSNKKYEITILRESATAEVEVAEQVAWVKVTNKEVVSDREVRFTVAALKNAMPKTFKGSIVEVTDKVSGQSSFLHCRI